MLSQKQFRQFLGRRGRKESGNKDAHTGKSSSSIVLRRGLILLVVSIGLLVLALVINIRLTNQKTLSSPAPSALTSQAGPYTVALSITPNPPAENKPAHLVLRVTDTATGQPVSNAEVQVQGLMETMEMLTRALEADPQGNGVYVTDANLSMFGPWRLQVIITPPNAPSASTQFQVTTR